MASWNGVKNILCIRTDNMGDLIMSAPAMRALKTALDAKITVLTSPMGGLIAPYLPEIDQTVIHDIPWVKTKEKKHSGKLEELVKIIRSHKYDAAVIFTVYSQNPLPSAMMTYMAGIPKTLSYCRENPYALISDWFPDKEPYSFIQHQVERDLKLVESVGAKTGDDLLHLSISAKAETSAMRKIKEVCGEEEYLIFHPGVSEEKRMYPVNLWITAGQLLTKRLKKKIIVTGSASEIELAQKVASGIGNEAFVAAGIFSVEEFIAAVKNAFLVVSVNTATVHIAAATKTPLIVLYALTNPQHTPWRSPAKVLPFLVEKEMQSRNEIIAYVNEHYFKKMIPFPQPEDILKSAVELTAGKKKNMHAPTVIKL